MLGGMCAGLFSTLINNPFDVIKTRMQGIEAAQYNNIFDCGKKIVINEGILQLWSGVIPRLARVLPGQTLIFGFSEMITNFLMSNFTSLA